MAEVTKRERAFEGKAVQVDVVTVENEGKNQEREIVRHKPGVSIVVLRERGGETAQGYEVVMVKQFRAPAEKELIELVAGIIDEGETPLETAQRELKEEVGFQANQWIELGTLYASPGYLDEKMTIFLARDLRFVGDEPEETENLTISTIPFTLALENLQKGEIEDLKTAAGLLWASVYLSNEMSV